MFVRLGGFTDTGKFSDIAVNFSAAPVIEADGRPGNGEREQGVEGQVMTGHEGMADQPGGQAGGRALPTRVARRSGPVPATGEASVPTISALTPAGGTGA
ncbi:hypothetical protein GCM10009863_28750 [Streptomyces axinellae]|uniref:Uncharacterized protein n=2 Tax=Streptomyces axinellae TaxID=552788 RepID=A0ABP6CI15_9ACTN